MISYIVGCVNKINYVHFVIVYHDVTNSKFNISRMFTTLQLKCEGKEMAKGNV